MPRTLLELFFFFFFFFPLRLLMDTGMEKTGGNRMSCEKIKIKKEIPLSYIANEFLQVYHFLIISLRENDAPLPSVPHPIP